MSSIVTNKKFDPSSSRSNRTKITLDDYSEGKIIINLDESFETITNECILLEILPN